MKIAIISDIHANEQALDAVISDMRGREVDSVVCLGDVATLGPSPREVLHKIQALNCPCIIGNHEEAIFSPENAAKYDIKENLSSTLYWCLKQLRPEDIDFLRGFVPTALVPLIDDHYMLCYHGSPRSTIEGIYPDTPINQLNEVFKGIEDSATLVVGGHTHVQMLRQHNDIVIINPGSVGCAFKVPHIPRHAPLYLPIAEYAIVECSNIGNSVELKRVNYDIQGFISAINSSDLPLKDWWNSEFNRLGYKK